MNNDYDYLYKVILIGDASVGKSNILNRFVRNKFEIDSKSTIGVEFATKTILVNKERIKIQLWDTAGQERFRAVTSAYYRGAQGIVLVFDVTNRSSFEHVEKWLREIRDNGDPTNITVLVGNKIDLIDKRVVSREESIAFATREKIYYIETSAKDNIKIEDIFNICAVEIYKKRNIKVDKIEPELKSVKILQLPPKKVDKKCC